MMNDLKIVKIGGNIIDNNELLKVFLIEFSKLEGQKILIHGGGKTANHWLKKLGIEPKMVNGRRITDKNTMEVVAMAYASLNKKITSILQSLNTNALGLCGADLNLIEATKRPVKDIDYGFAGDIKVVKGKMLMNLVNSGFVPVFSPLTHDSSGILLNTNADTIASALSVSLSMDNKTELIYCFEEEGVLKDLKTKEIYDTLDHSTYEKAVDTGILTNGIIPKIDNAFRAIDTGVSRVVICHAKALSNVGTKSFKGTIIYD